MGMSKCPICAGNGTIKRDSNGFPIPESRPMAQDSRTAETCHSCGGNGYIVYDDCQMIRIASEDNK